MKTLTRVIVATIVALSVAGLTRTPAPGTRAAVQDRTSIGFSTSTGGYSVRFRALTGTVEIGHGANGPALAIRELGGTTKSDLLYAVRSARRAGSSYVLTGSSGWATFSFVVTTFSTVPGLLRFQLAVKPSHDAPARAGLLPDAQLIRASANNLKLYVDAPPVAGTSIFLSSTALHSSFLYLANLTTLGTYFDRTHSGGGQSFFSFPRAGGEGALVGAGAHATFGYAPPPSSLANLPHGKSTPVVDSFLYIIPTVPSDGTGIASTYLQLLSTVFRQLPKPSFPAPDWKSIASKTASDLNDAANLVTVNGHRYLRSYVSDTRSSPELITQAGIVAGVRAYENRFHVSLPIDAILEDNLPTFFDPTFHSVKNGLGQDPAAREESWYYIGNLISILQAAQAGSPAALKLLRDSADAAILLAHTNNYEFPQNFPFSDWNGKDTGLQADAAGGYAWVMLGLYDITKDNRFLAEAQASIKHVAGKGFDLSYEMHMTAYTAAAAQRLYTMTGDEQYHSDATIALANFFHATRLWDCTYGFCRKGNGYHTYMGVNILPWGDYIAMREQYESWLALRDYLSYAQKESTNLRNLVQVFVDTSPALLQYSLPPALPPGDVPTSPGLYSFVHHNNVGWNIPVEDLREGESQSGAIGQEIYGAGGPFWLAAFGP